MSRISPFVRNLAILALVAILIVALNQETALLTAATLLRFAFFIVIGVVANFFWRDVGRHEIDTWPAWSSRVFYAAVALFVVDVGWWVVIGITGRDVLAAIVVAAICAYVGVTTWRGQRSVL
jgi:hypothetical protein